MLIVSVQYSGKIGILVQNDGFVAALQRFLHRIQGPCIFVEFRLFRSVVGFRQYLHVLLFTLCPQDSRLFLGIRDQHGHFLVGCVADLLRFGCTAGCISCCDVVALGDHTFVYRFFVVGACDLRIEHCLCAKEDTKFERIEEVYSHPQALSQCNIFLKSFDFTGVTYTNTAAAAKYVAESKKHNIGAICSVSAAKKYGLKILRRSVQNITNNTTRFIVISKELVLDNSADKISLIFSAPHTTGSLYRVLGRFSMSGLNLTKLESRPMAKGKFDYFFYVDVMGNVLDASTLDLLCALSDELPEFTFLGNYHEINKD